MDKNEFNLSGETKEKLTRDILSGFHTQFAENQRIREQSFLKILGFLGAVVFGYAYVYHNLSDSTDEVNIFSLVTIASELILTFGSWVVVTIAYNFRRDQVVIARIREECGVLGDDKIFPKAFDPCSWLKSDSRKYAWIPDFLLVFYVIFPVFQVILAVSFALRTRVFSDLLSPCFYELDWYELAAVAFSIITLTITIYLPWFYRKKLRNKAESWCVNSPRKDNEGSAEPEDTFEDKR